MKCPYCQHNETKVLDSRESLSNTSIRRRRECLKCSKRFTTYERIETSNIIVVKKDGRREAYDRNKLKKGIIIACQKRQISAETIDSIIDKIEQEIIAGKSEVTSKKLGELVMKYLKKVDKVAYIRFASVYREFTDITSFEEELRKLIRK
ncbi:transcriptional repressor NrdR [Candidatus Woesearchaeota archaeon]|nr:MAG: transcriptional repressor NrdR [Candidatus Woesearchaeota archaeon]